MTHRYIGTKVITAWSEDRVEQVTATSDKKIRQGYAVKYEDGYVSWSPRETFVEAYRLAEGKTQCLTFGDALHFLKLGYKVSRAGWNGKGLWLEVQRPDAGSKMTLPYIFISYPTDAWNTPGARVPWVPSISDCLAEDWSVL